MTKANAEAFVEGDPLRSPSDFAASPKLLNYSTTDTACNGTERDALGRGDGQVVSTQNIVSKSPRLNLKRALAILLGTAAPLSVGLDVHAQTAAPTIIPGRGVRVLRVRFQPATTCSAVDDTVDPVAAMVPVGGIKSAEATIAPIAHAPRIRIFSINTGVVTVTPPTASGSPQGIQLGGVSRGGGAIRTNTTTSGVLRTLSAFTKERIDRTVVIHAIAEEDDDVAVPGEVCVSAGPNGVFNSIPSGDDSVISATEIGSGLDWRCDTPASGDDVQAIPTGTGRPNRICVTRGGNAFLDSVPAGDDQVVSDDISTGADGICQTPARSSNLIPTAVPTAAALQAELNRIWGLQANIFFTVTRIDTAVNYDLDRNRVLADPVAGSATIDEIEAIATRARSAGNYNIYYVNQMEIPNAFTLQEAGIPVDLQNSTWIQDAHANSTVNVSAHEVGHLLGSVRESADLLDVMLGFGHASNPCEVRRVDWNTVNP